MPINTSKKSFLLWGVLLATLVVANLSVQAFASRQLADCDKACGAYEPNGTWTRSCSGAGSFDCYVTQCTFHKPECGYSDNFNDVCYYPWYYCN